MQRTYFYIFLFLFPALLVLGADKDPPSWAQSFMRSETNNSYKPETEVREEFRPEARTVFPIKSIDIPVNELHVVDSHSGGKILRNQILVEKNEKKYFRFFLHPESEELYMPLIKKYGAQELYLASATASTRGLLAWPKNPKDGAPLFLKLSLAKVQDGLGRIIPGWEVRRSIGISELAQRTSSETWMNSGASIIPEVMGAYVDKKQKLGFFVDEEQGKVFEHGLIIRDASFLQDAEKRGWEVRPLFSLFTPDGDKPPLIIQKWRQTKKPFIDFINDYLFTPFIQKNRHLFFEEHIVPEIHGQNVVVAIDPKTLEIKHFYHRDVGSMKVDLRMRMMEGKDVEPLRSVNAAYDYKFLRATSAIEDVYKDYLHNWLFRWAYQDEIKKYVPSFSPQQTQDLLQYLLRKEARALYPLKKGDIDGMTVTQRLEKYLVENPPPLRSLADPVDAKKMRSFLAKQEKASQFIELPSSWVKFWKLRPGEKVLTSQGVIVAGEKAEKSKLYFHVSRNMAEVLKNPIPLRVVDPKGLRVGFFSGTFDPPHEGHRILLDDAMRRFDLDLIYVIPTPTPEHKPGATSFKLRQQMVQAFFSDDSRIHVADDDLARVAQVRGIGGLQRLLAGRHKKDQVYQIMGADALERILANASITFPKNFSLVVGERAGSNYFFPAKTSGGNDIYRLGTKDEVALSSTMMRKMLAAGKQPRGISDPVYSLIIKNQLYGAGGHVHGGGVKDCAQLWQALHH